MVLAAFDDTLLEDERMLRRPDALLDISTRNVLLLAATLHFGLAVVLCRVRDLLAKVLLVLWAVSVCAIYSFGVGWLRAGASSPVVILTAHKLGINGKAMGIVWELLLAAMAVVVLLQLELERRGRKREQEALTLERWREFRKQGGKFPWAG